MALGGLVSSLGTLGFCALETKREGVREKRGRRGAPAPEGLAFAVARLGAGTT